MTVIYGNNIAIYLLNKTIIIDKFIKMSCRNCKINLLIVTDRDTISMSDGHSLLTDPSLSIIKILSTT